MSGPQCCENAPTLGSGSRQEDRIEEIGGLKSYTAGSLASKLAVVLISDIFGYEAPKLRQLADKVAAAGFYVVVPDFFYGDPYVPDNTERPLSSWLPNHQPVTTKVPTAILGAEIDEHSPPEQMKKIGEILSAKSVDNFVKIYPGVVHGWTVRYKDDDEHVVKCAMEAHTDMLNWFTKYLK